MSTESPPTLESEECEKQLLTYKEYLKQLLALNAELERVGSTEPFDSVYYENLTDTVNRLNELWDASLVRKRWIILLAWLLLGPPVAVLLYAFFLYCVLWLLKL